MFSCLFCTFCIFVFKSHNLVLFLVWKLDLDFSFSLCSCGFSCPWHKGYSYNMMMGKYKVVPTFKKNLLEPYHAFTFQDKFMNHLHKCEHWWWTKIWNGWCFQLKNIKSSTSIPHSLMWIWFEWTHLGTG